MVCDRYETTGSPAVFRWRKTGDFASPSRGGFALFGGRQSCRVFDTTLHIWFIGAAKKNFRPWAKKTALYLFNNIK
jgi:hypothetical protein